MDPPVDQQLDFQYFPRLPPEIRREIWRISSAGAIINVYYDKTGISTIRLHPLLVTCHESRQVCTCSVACLEGKGIMAAGPLHAHSFRIHSFKLGFETTTIDRLKNIILFQPNDDVVDRLLRADSEVLELRVCLSNDISVDRLMAPASKFRRACPTCPCTIRPRKFYWHYSPSPVPRQILENQKLPGSQPCPGCTWARCFAEARITRRILDLPDYEVTVDSTLSSRPAVDEILTAVIPILRFIKKDQPMILDIDESSHETLDEPEEMFHACDSGTCVH
ncbi:hypothetical protein FALBO_7955 [Fusarium albosuccineum]|uniref:2EXR domain-containing protein n=1 Tax=Fusarium albosuccineum TaxID=1237068 RepID=A0A8H4LAE1_9HYPO|nr:hypothetical protein FALBO_7955 [Fusarium albosuccineum]